MHLRVELPRCVGCLRSENVDEDEKEDEDDKVIYLLELAAAASPVQVRDEQPYAKKHCAYRRVRGEPLGPEHAGCFEDDKVDARAHQQAEQEAAKQENEASAPRHADDEGGHLWAVFGIVARNPQLGERAPQTPAPPLVSFAGDGDGGGVVVKAKAKVEARGVACVSRVQWRFLPLFQRSQLPGVLLLRCALLVRSLVHEAVPPALKGRRGRHRDVALGRRESLFS